MGFYSSSRGMYSEIMGLDDTSSFEGLINCAR